MIIKSFEQCISHTENTSTARFKYSSWQRFLNCISLDALLLDNFFKKMSKNRSFCRTLNL